MKWEPDYSFVGERGDVFIIGGGPSLRNFNWDLLVPFPTIGCNMAFSLGESVCKMCVFGDIKWFDKFNKPLQNFKRPVLTNNPYLHTRNIDWLCSTKRMNKGLSKDPSLLGWNGHTGSVAINAALIMGAKRIMLLGFDMVLDRKAGPNWHKEILSVPNEQCYQRFLDGFHYICRDLSLFPGVSIINLNPDSKLERFPKMSFETFMEGNVYETCC